jgi:hypothetical protein
MTKISPSTYLKEIFNFKQNRWFWWDLLAYLSLVPSLVALVKYLIIDGNIAVGSFAGLAFLTILIFCSARFTIVIMGLFYSFSGKTLKTVRDENIKNSLERLGKNKTEISAKLELRQKSAISWFYWIAGLTLVNIVLLVTNSSISLLFGLGGSNLAVAIGTGLSRSSGNWVFQFTSMVIAVSLAGIFMFIARRAESNPKFVSLGLLLYALDLFFVLLLGDFLSLSFHIFAIMAISLQYYSAKNLLKISNK